MGEPIVFSLTYKELVTAILKQQGINEGLWGIYLKFGIQGANVGPDENNLLPSAVVPVMEIGIQKVDKLNNLAVDAAEVNLKKTKKHSKIHT